jgi:tetratricopeptide (TPR) repeat protein
MLFVTLLTASVCAGSTPDALSDCQQAWQTGDYAKCLELATAAIDARSYGEEWPILKARAELALGKYPAALDSIAAGIERYSWSVRLQQLRIEAALANGNREMAATAISEVEKLASTASWRYTDADDLTCLGEVALQLGADPKAVQASSNALVATTQIAPKDSSPLPDWPSTKVTRPSLPNSSNQS